MAPSYFLLVAIAVTLSAWLVQTVRLAAHHRALRRLASEWDMHYSAGDRFRLADRVAEIFPVTGAADVRVGDLIYDNVDGGYRYIFACEFTQGVVRWKHRRRRVATFWEPKDRADAAGWSPLVLAAEDLPVIEQYKALHKQTSNKQGAGEQVDAVAHA